MAAKRKLVYSYFGHIKKNKFEFNDFYCKIIFGNNFQSSFKSVDILFDKI